MKHIFLLAAMLLSATMIKAQHDAADMAVHKIVFQLTSGDSAVHKMFMRQLDNVLAAAPNAKVEVVCHGPGITMLTASQTKVQPKITELKNKGIAFVVCENTLRQKNVSKEEIVQEAGFVKAGIIEIVIKQEEGWSYIKAGQ